MLRLVIVAFALIFLGSCNNPTTEDSTKPIDKDAKPVLGWNSFPSYHNFFSEELAREQLAAFNEKLKPHGYEYFILDNGWAGGDHVIELDEYGRNLPYTGFYPDGVAGFKRFVDDVHALDIKLGVWIVRGVNREAVKRKLPIKGTPYFAQDIADTTDTCYWCNHNYGVDMSKPGAQEYYDSKVDLLAEYGVDLIKYDDIVDYPEEMEAVSKAVQKAREKYNRDIVLSFSPGNFIKTENVPYFRMGDMVRISCDIWDHQRAIDDIFWMWEVFMPYRNDNFFLDMDMIPMGYFQRFERHDTLTYDQKLTFLTQRAIGASPLIFGGSITKSENYIIDLISNKGLLECNQNAVTGSLWFRDKEKHIDVWGTFHNENEDSGWLGVFNRSEKSIDFTITKENMGLSVHKKYSLYDIWNDKDMVDKQEQAFVIPPHGVYFIKFDCL